MNSQAEATEQIDPGTDERDNRETPGDDAPKNRGRTLSVIALLMAILALAASALSGYLVAGSRDLLPAFARQEQQIKDLEQHLGKLGQEITSLGLKLDSRETAAGTMQQELDGLRSSIRTLQDQEGPSAGVLLAETEQLLILAHHRLSLARDIETALAAMQMADQRLSHAEDPRILALRSTLTSDMNAIQSVNQPDIPGISLYLADLVTRVDSLTLKETGSAATPTGDSEQSPSPDPLPVWKRLLNTVWQELRGLVVISRDTTDPRIFLLPEQRYFLYLNLRLQLESARLSLLQGDTENFQSSLGLVNEWLERYFLAADSGVAAIQESLNLMTGIDLQPTLPDIRASLSATQALRDEIMGSDRSEPGN